MLNWGATQYCPHVPFCNLEAFGASQGRRIQQISSRQGFKADSKFSIQLTKSRAELVPRCLNRDSKGVPATGP